MTLTGRRPPVRRALSIAVGYEHLAKVSGDPLLELPGTHQDPYILRKLLVDLFHYRAEDVNIMIDDGKHMRPTKHNILRAMRQLVADAQPGDHFFFHFSGHGSQIPNLNGTEKDGFDEGMLDSAFAVIWPCDVRYRGDGKCTNYIMDDWIHQILVDQVPHGAHVMMVFDCCHSGTAADLPYTSDDFRPPSPLILAPISTTASPHNSKSIRVRGTHHGNDSPAGGPRKTVQRRYPVDPMVDVTSWSACEDNQRTYGDNKGGLFVRMFNRVLRHHPHATHGDVLRAVTRGIEKMIVKAREVSPPDSPLFTPHPELSSEEKLDTVWYRPVVDDADDSDS
ncbi:peptidase C14 [Laetiporus sulphureus 93-53]|uniref:Peptidase C14 n=1 Tax=Laetiporus sulphureus 93-53 TaxID=1314785 RepID=A0A165DBA3_9APHY|nr:peptidase C14 [Laetiporus sulphureus 93-53]KZT04476.1 peptidase C14 [Laetiporus sulphureus 93-53]